MRDVLLIRHAQSEANVVLQQPKKPVDNYSAPLTSLGHIQAEELKQFLEEINFTPDLVIHSPFARTTQTAQILFTQNQKQIDYSIRESHWTSEIIQGIHGKAYLKLQDHEIPNEAQEVFQKNIHDLLRLVSELSESNHRITVVAHRGILTALYHAIVNPEQKLTQKMLHTIMKSFEFCRGFWFDRINNQLSNPQRLKINSKQIN